MKMLQDDICAVIDTQTDEACSTLGNVNTKTENEAAKPINYTNSYGDPDSLETFIESTYALKYNVVTGKVLIKEVESESEFKVVSDYDINSICRRANFMGVKAKPSDVVRLLWSDFTPKFDPFREYMHTISFQSPWDGKTDHIGNWADTFATTNQNLWKVCFRKWLVALVGSLLDDEVVNHVAPVLIGKQGLGKTQGIARLVPPQLKDYYFSGSIDPSQKDAVIQLAECMLIDLDELEALSKSSIGDLKSLMTRKSIRIRRPYGRQTENMPRRASFIGSINSKEFLRDETGSRRFLCFEVNAINYLHKLEIDRMYSQAVALYKAGFKYWFSQEEIAAIQLHNEQFKNYSMEEELLVRHFQACSIEEASNFYAATDLGKILKAREGLSLSNSTVQRVGKALAANRFLKTKRNGRYVYAVIDKARLKHPKMQVAGLSQSEPFNNQSNPQSPIDLG